jgi:uncharacterized repeat protein (TIGR01451 family)
VGETGINIDIVKKVRNVTANQTTFADSIDAQGLDNLEFEIRVKNIGTAIAKEVILKDILPAELFYVVGTTKVDGVTVADGIITATGISLGDMNPSAERVITFSSVIYYGTPQKQIVNEARVSAKPPATAGTNNADIVLTWSSRDAASCSASSGWNGTKALSGTEVVDPATPTEYKITCSNGNGSRYASIVVGPGGATQVADNDNAIIVVRNRGQVLGAATVVTGPEDVALIVTLVALVGSLGIYFYVSGGRSLAGLSFAGVLADNRLKFQIWKIRRRERYADTRDTVDAIFGPDA